MLSPIFSSRILTLTLVVTAMSGRPPAPLPPQPNLSHTLSARGALGSRSIRMRRREPDASLSRGIANLGDPHRMDRVRHALRRGDPVLVAALGASVTSDYAGIDGNSQALHPSVCAAALRQCGRGCRWVGWLQDTVDSLRTALPKAHVTAINCGLPGSPLSFAAPCLESHVPASADLVVVDAATIRSSPQSVEAILRRLLSLPRQPAVVLLHFFHWCATNRGCSAPAGVEPWSHAHMAANWLAGARMERDLTDLAAYYGLPALSVRAAHFHAALNATRAGESPGESLGRRARWLTKDGLHPTRRGNRQIAALLTPFLLAPPLPLSPQQPQSLPLPLPLPPPLHHATTRGAPPGAARMAEQCFGWSGPEAVPELERHEGWRLVNEHPAHHAASQRPGLVSSRPGSTVVFRLPAFHWARAAAVERGDGAADACSAPPAARADGLGQRAGSADARGAGGALTVQYVSSSTHGMGMAELRCIMGCTCRPACLDARHRPAAEQSNVGSAGGGTVGRASEVPVQLHAPYCVVSLRLTHLANWTGPSSSSSSGSSSAAPPRSRFKVTGLSLRSWPAETS